MLSFEDQQILEIAAIRDTYARTNGMHKDIDIKTEYVLPSVVFYAMRNKRLKSISIKYSDGMYVFPVYKDGTLIIQRAISAQYFNIRKIYLPIKLE